MLLKTLVSHVAPVRPRWQLLVAGLILAGAANSHAGIITISGIDPNGPEVRIPHPNADAAQASFFANLSGVGTETFESFAPNTTPATLVFPGAGSASFSGAPLVASVPTGTNGAGRYPISGNNYLEAATGSFGVTFTQPIAAFGFYGVDIGDFGGTLTLHLANSVSTVLTVPAAPQATANGSVLYFGFFTTSPSEVFTSVTFDNPSVIDVFAFDDMTIGSLAQVKPVATPEPATLTIFGIGIACIAGYGLARRKRAK